MAQTKQLGLSLLEVLVALAISASVMLGVLLMQQRLLSDSYAAYWQTRAVIQVQSMLERLRVNHSVGARQREYSQWSTMNRKLLPQGSGQYRCGSFEGYCHVVTRWWQHVQHTYALSARIV